MYSIQGSWAVGRGAKKRAKTGTIMNTITKLEAVLASGVCRCFHEIQQLLSMLAAGTAARYTQAEAHCYSSNILRQQHVPEAAFTVPSARASCSLSASASRMRAWKSAFSRTTCRHTRCSRRPEAAARQQQLRQLKDQEVYRSRKSGPALSSAALQTLK